MHSSTHPTISDEVTVTEMSGEWHVAVREGSSDPVVRSFANEKFALNYAEGQKDRLRIERASRM